MAAERASVRAMRDDDIPALVEIDSITSGMPRGEYIQAKARQATSGKQGSAIALVAESDGRPVGFLMGQVYLGEYGIPGGVATVDTLGIHPDQQSEGVARMLMDAFVGHARTIGVERIRTVVEWSQWELISYFRAVGFAPGTSMVLERLV